MTALLFSSSTVFNGIREYGQVTNTHGGYFTTGAATTSVTLQLPFYPDVFQWWNYTEFGTNDQNLNGIWFRDFPAGDALIVTRGTTTLSSSLETTNGLTPVTTGPGFTDEHVAISGITAGTPGVVNTSTAHGLTSGMRVYITNVVGTVAPFVNNKEFVVTVTSSTQFTLYDTFGAPVPVLGTWTSGGIVTIEGPDLGIENAPELFYVTLGSAIVGAESDVTYFIATQFNSYQNRGTLTA